MIPREKRIRPLKKEMNITVVVQPGIEKPNKALRPSSLPIIVAMISKKEKNEVISPR